MAASTLSLVSGRTFGCSFSTRETVWCETPASRATSAMTGGLDRSPDPGSTDPCTRLLAFSPGDDVTWCLLCRARRGALRSAGADVSVHIRAGLERRCHLDAPDSNMRLIFRRPESLYLRVASARARRYPGSLQPRSGASPGRGLASPG